MKTLVLNCGSSSIKYKLFDMTSGEVMAQGGIEKVGLPDSFLKFTDKNGEKVILEKAIPDHTVGIAFILDTLTDAKYGCLKNFKDINAVGHRVVHGAEKFASSVHDVAVSRISTQYVRDDFAKGLREKALVDASDGVMHVFFRGADAAPCVPLVAHYCFVF